MCLTVLPSERSVKVRSDGRRVRCRRAASACAASASRCPGALPFRSHTRPHRRVILAAWAAGSEPKSKGTKLSDASRWRVTRLTYARAGLEDLWGPEHEPPPRSGLGDFPRITPSRPIVPDGAFEHGLADHLRATMLAKALLELWGRFTDAPATSTC